MSDRTAHSLGVAAALIDLFIGVLTIVFTRGFSSLSFMLVALFDASPMLIAGIGVIAGLVISTKRSTAKRGVIIVLIAGLLPVLVLYDVVHTIVAYGNEYISFPLSLVFLLLLVVPMALSTISGTLALRRQRHP